MNHADREELPYGFDNRISVPVESVSLQRVSQRGFHGSGQSGFGEAEA